MPEAAPLYRFQEDQFELTRPERGLIHVRILDSGGVAAHATTHQNGGSDEISVAGLSGLLADAQTALAHKTSHQNGGADELNVVGLSGLLADPQTPVAHSHAAGDLPVATTTALGIVELATDGESAPSVVVQGNDARNSNARTPLAHKTSHENGGSDEISVAGLSGLLADGQTPLAHDIITGHNGFPGGTSNFLRADGTFAAPGGGAGADPPEGSYAPGSYIIATGKFRNACKRQQFTTTQRLTLQGTARLSLQN